MATESVAHSGRRNPNSPTTAAKAKAVPEKKAGRSKGHSTRHSLRQGPAPSTRAAPRPFCYPEGDATR